MRPLSVRLFRNLRNPVRLVDWASYQLSRGNDVYLSTLPSSGTHWLRFIIAKGIVDAYNLDYEFTSISPYKIVPTFRGKNQRFAFNDLTDVPRVQHTHKSYSIFLRNKRVLVLVRDLRDTMVSSYETYSERHDPSITFSEFLRADGVNEKRHRTLKRRIEFLNRWQRNWQHLDDYLLVRYEDLKSETYDITSSVFEFIELDNISESLIEDAIEFSSIEHMRYIEKHGKANPDLFEEQDERVTSADEGAKINEGTTNRYTDYFDGDDKQYFQRLVDEKLEDDFGYDYDEYRR